jgi:DNA-directed RNA polymerase sigma subunit (sigma70/sigma32)
VRRDGRGPRLGLGLSDSASEEVLLRRYLQEIEQHPPLAADEELRLARLARDGDVDAGEALIRSNLQLVVAIARRFVATGLPLLDLVQEGNLGLMQAVEGFDPDRGFGFRTYAMWWIRSAIAGAVAEHSPASSAPPDPLQVAWDALVARHGRHPTIAELAADLGMDEDEVARRLGAPPSS